MPKVKEVIGIDFGAQAVKLVRLTKTGDRLALLDYQIIETSPFNEVALAAGKDVQITEEVLLRIKAYCEQVDLRKVSVIVVVDGQRVFNRVFKLPAVGRSKLQKIVRYEAQQQVPFPINEVVWSYQLLRKVSPEEADVALSAVKKDVIEQYLRALEKIDVPVADLIVPVASLYNLVYRQFPVMDQPTMILDIGAKTTSIIILENENIWFRAVPLGGGLITQAISEEFNLSLVEAEELKKEKGRIILEAAKDREDFDPRAKRLSACIVRSLSRLLGEITRSLEVYSCSFNSLGIRRIFLIGGTSRLRNLSQFIIKKFRVNVEEIAVTQGLELADSVPRENIAQAGCFLGVALGAALQGLNLSRLDLSLLPREIVRQQQWRKKQSYCFIIAGLLIFLGLSYSGYNFILTNIYQANIRKLESEKKSLAFNQRELAKVQKGLDQVMEELNLIDNTVVRRHLWTEMLLSLEEIIPVNMWLVRITPGKDKGDGCVELTLKGKTTGNYQDLIVFRNALDASSLFVHGSSKVISASPPEDGIRDFLISTEFNIKKK